MPALRFIPYSAPLHARCLALFDENCPASFAPGERTHYEAFLERAPAGYRIAVEADDVIGAFGLVDEGTRGRRRVNWIMVAARAQGRGAGAAMMAHAIRDAQEAQAGVIEIAASHLSTAFFARFGARTVRHVADGWGPGMHRVDMELRLSETLFSSPGGEIAMPRLVLVPRGDGGHLVVNPPREVWERSELTRDELTGWTVLVAATGRAMLDVLPQLTGGCINYWEAGNWALNAAADPAGPKDPRRHRRVHLHLLGRSPHAGDASWEWGEAPRFPRFAERETWAAAFDPLTADECDAVVARAAELLETRYAV